MQEDIFPNVAAPNFEINTVNIMLNGFNQDIIRMAYNMCIARLHKVYFHKFLKEENNKHKKLQLYHALALYTLTQLSMHNMTQMNMLIGYLCTMYRMCDLCMVSL